MFDSLALYSILVLQVDSDASVDFGPAGGLNPPHGGVLIDLMASPERHDEVH